MNNTKFTHGKWVVDYKGTIGHIKALIEPEKDKTPTIARYDTKVLSISDTEKKANAHLIASVPDMYELLDRISKANQVWSIEEINELLARARGDNND